MLSPGQREAVHRSTGVRLQPASEADLDRLSQIYGRPLPAVWRDFLAEYGGDESAVQQLMRRSGRAERLSGHTCDFWAELSGVAGAVSLAEGPMRADVARWEEVLGAPVYHLADVGDGMRTVLVGDADDPMVANVIAGVTGDVEPGAAELVALRLSSLLRGVLLTAEFGTERLFDHSAFPPSVFTTAPASTSLGLTGAARHRVDNAASDIAAFRAVAWETVPELAALERQLMGRVDEILDALVGITLPDSSLHTSIEGHRWIRRSLGLWRPMYGALAEGIRTVPVEALRSRSWALHAAIVGVAVMELHPAAEVTDNIGMFGHGPGARLSTEEALNALLSLRVDGDFDDLCLNYRETVAGPAYRQLRGS